MYIAYCIIQYTIYICIYRKGTPAHVIVSQQAPRNINVY